MEADVEGGDIPPDEEEPPQPEEESEKRQPKKKASSKTVAKAKTPEPESDEVDDVPGDGHASAAAGPAVRRLARQLGVELRRVRPTGASGRITVEDVRAHVRETNEQVAATMPRGVTPPGAPDTDEYGGVRLEKMSRLRQTIARNMRGVVHDDSAAHEFRRCRRHRAGGHARAEQGGLRRPRHQAHVAAVLDQGGCLVAQAAPDC